jgi:hypothetical protein
VPPSQEEATVTQTNGQDTLPFMEPLVGFLQNSQAGPDLVEKPVTTVITGPTNHQNTVHLDMLKVSEKFVCVGEGQTDC